ncbi:uncharacterized protein PRCAT00000829001 [Priceomyces carsonii]|uniref:uncharacterized protein n=1 Tax=Priceomyces carsonii TaxID=28549 RepID=UPI002ED86F29|nr:unnamed protein product [Priceomyces carsonii]
MGSGLLDEEPLCRVQRKKSLETILRYVTFNVNGAKTLFNYYPWNRLQQSYDKMFNSLEGDVISLQELKLTPANISSVEIGNLKHYSSFISLPKQKKGYSGVGLFVRIPKDEECDAVRCSLRVIKAEEGLTGYLKSADYPTSSYRNLKPSEHIGGYPTEMQEEEGLRLDSEGRCVVVELADNTVIFSLYCPANSSGLEEGEKFRLKFVHVLLERCYYLKFKLGKDVILMGDINVSLDLIDHADEINQKMKQNVVKRAPDGAAFERVNYNECIAFKKSTPARRLLNDYVLPTLASLDPSGKQFLYDSTRKIQGRKMGLYTVWNTLTGARQSNYGSRIDLILTSSPSQFNSIVDAGIWPFLQGSDHCPVFTDFKVNSAIKFKDLGKPSKLKFQARAFFKLVKHHDISQLFKPQLKSSKRYCNESSSPETQDNKKPKFTYASRKTSRSDQGLIVNYFQKGLNDDKKGRKDREIKEDIEDKQDKEDIEDQPDPKVRKKEPKLPRSISAMTESIYGKPPLCYHGIPCQMKTSLNNSKTRGRKFWCCASNSRKALDSNRMSTKSECATEGTKCSFFQWVNGNKNSKTLTTTKLDLHAGSL